ncbi:MAG: hypothetical protein ACLQUZ_13435 [Rhizomicrobium sp.]
MVEKIEIDDLLAPHLTGAQRQMIAAAEAQPFQLSEDAVLQAARAATGLSDFGPEDFRLGDGSGEHARRRQRFQPGFDPRIRFGSERF